jgi:rhodanese-related sulfurtransferase
MILTPADLVAEARRQITEIDVAATAAAVAQGIAVIDVREPAEFAAGRLPGARNVPRGVLEFKTGEQPALADREAELIIYCKTGGRAALATVSLQRLGYTRLRSLSGGFEAWLAAGQIVESDTQTHC